MRRAPLLPVLLALALATGGTGCGSDTAGDGAGLRVVATTTQIADFARNVGGAGVSVTQLLQPGTEAHEYDPTADDLAALAEADVILANGAGLDDWIDRLREQSGAGAPVVRAADGVTLRRGEDGDDPHIWMDPVRAEQMVATLAEGLADADAASAANYRARGAEYRARLRDLDAELAKLIAPVPAARRMIVTDHDAFGYFTERYRITVVGTVIPSVATGAEPSARELATLTRLIREKGVRAVFAESGLDPALARALADESGARLGEALYADSLGPAGSPGATYLEMMRHNMRAVVNAIS